MMDFTPYNPLDKKNLGASVAEALLERPVLSLGEVPVFEGAGVYVIYYTGTFPAYLPLARRNANGNFVAPIYIGKAVPPGARKGGLGFDAAPSRALHKRLGEHADSIKAATNLDIDDFRCRLLVVDDIWIPLGEALLITKFAPIWNKLVDGFGNHNPGSGRHAGMRPRWDILHPGRGWAMKCQERPETAEQIITEVEAYLRVAPAPSQVNLHDP